MAVKSTRLIPAGHVLKRAGWWHLGLHQVLDPVPAENDLLPDCPKLANVRNTLRIANDSARQAVPFPYRRPAISLTA